jgi:chemotaxis signal transduction protein
MNYHGELIWVIDLAQYLSHLIGLVTVPSTPDNVLTTEKLILITLGTLQSQTGNSSQPVAWVVSQVHGIVALHPAKFRPIPAPFKSLLAPYLSGLTELEVKADAIESTTVAVLSSLFLEKSEFSRSTQRVN